MKDELKQVTMGLKLSTKPNETWLHFEAGNGKRCSFCIEAKFPTICASAIRQWAFDILGDPVSGDIK